MMLMRDPIRVAIVGCGAIADFHLQALAAIPAARCTALFDVDPKRAEAIRARHSLDAEIVTTLDEVAQRADAAVVAVPNRFHAEYCIRLLRASLHVLCEKPLALSTSEARDMVAVARQTNRVLACGLVRRFFGATELAAEALRRELVGKPVHCEIRESSMGWPFSRSFFDRNISGGGVLIDSGPHTLDLLTYLLGPADLVEYRDDSEEGVEANSFLKARCLGRSGEVTADIHLTRSARIKSTWRIICTRGAIEIDSHTRDSIRLLFDGDQKPYTTIAQSAPADAFLKQMSNFLDACAGSIELRAPAAESIPVIEMIEQCYRTRQRSDERWAAGYEKSSVRVERSDLKKILVTGAAGLVGSRLVEMWAADGELSRLRCMTRSFHTAGRMMRFPVEVVEADLLDSQAIRKAVEGCDAIIHLGAGERAGRETQNIIDAALEFKVRRFVHISSACVYGLGLPSRIEELQEDTKLSKTGELYADGKADAERAVESAARRGLPAVMLRPQVVYGPGMRWSAELIELLAKDEVCIIEDGGWANLIYIDDLIVAISRALQSTVSNGEAIFVTDGNPIKWSNYISAHARLIGAEPARVNRQEVVRPKGGAKAWVRDSFRPLLPVLGSPEFRSFVLKSPLMQATAFRAYLFLREKKSLGARLSRLKNAAAQNRSASRRDWNEHWINLQLSESRLSPARAERLIGFKARIDFAEGLRRSLDWFEQFGLVTRRAEPDGVYLQDICLEAAGS
jgi:predicted dehydrogenase/nucleoside-diphosphate-sugar epimerase